MATVRRLRSWGYPPRFPFGYDFTPPDERDIDRPSRKAADWEEAEYCPERDEA